MHLSARLSPLQSWLSELACLECQRLEGHVRDRLSPSGGGMAGLHTYTATLGPFDEAVRSIDFLFNLSVSASPSAIARQRTFATAGAAIRFSLHERSGE